MKRTVFVGMLTMIGCLITSIGCKTLSPKQTPVVVSIPTNIVSPIATVPNKELKVFNTEMYSYQFDNWSYHLPKENWQINYSSYDIYREYILVRRNTSNTTAYVMLIKQINKHYSATNLWDDYVYSGSNSLSIDEIVINGNSFTRNKFSTKRETVIGLTMTKTNYDYLFVCSVPLYEEDTCERVANSLEIL